jgi:hypothetical protein
MTAFTSSEIQIIAAENVTGPIDGMRTVPAQRAAACMSDPRVMAEDGSRFAELMYLARTILETG